MAITLNGSTGVVAPEFDGTLDASNLTGALPAIDGSALTDLNAAELTGTLPAIDGSALTGISTTPTTAQVNSAISGTALNAVGSYALISYAGGSTLSAGTTTSTALYFGSCDNRVVDSGPSGTWRVMGKVQPGISNASPNTVMLRIA